MDYERNKKKERETGHQSATFQRRFNSYTKSHCSLTPVAKQSGDSFSPVEYTTYTLPALSPTRPRPMKKEENGEEDKSKWQIMSFNRRTRKPNKGVIEIKE